MVLGSDFGWWCWEEMLGGGFERLFRELMLRSGLRKWCWKLVLRGSVENCC